MPGPTTRPTPSYRPTPPALAAYVRALGGKLKIVAEFGDEQDTLGRQRPRPRIGGSIRGRGRA
ncbi:hypothetical protein OHA37_22010 [Streptomyces sp. NBC_00335]|uniref:hypothetical protein n=1 Tax=unclassified Streptomyces TaxID=2593676 RepID=UPI002257F741|nr:MULTISPECIES: hypothetical protein [unclassified Streptomyces]MCX5406538.1 hypothetical protein [Streptomyces sp. NBC_00086]